MQNEAVQRAEYTESKEAETKTTLVSRNITVQGKRTSVRMEPEMWSALREIASQEQCSIHDICTLISLRKKENSSLTAAIRVFIMLYFRAASTDEGHKKAGHGDFDHMRRRARIPEQLANLFSQRKQKDDAGRGGVNLHAYSYANNDGYRQGDAVGL